MPQGQVLEFNRVTKRFGDVTAVADLSVRVEPGVVTAFLGPNGAGKTTSLRMLLGQIRPTSGTATIGGSAYSELRQPLRSIGAVLEEASYRPRRTAARQLSIAAKANGIPASRVDEVLRLVGLQDDADTRLGSYSLGMRQRLAVASALLGDPGVLVLDEPANGLDPEGIRWMRLLMRRLADEGRTVLVSSHVLSEIEQVADDVVVLSKGRAVFAGSIDKLADPAGGAVIVDAEHRAQLITALSAAKLNFDVLRSGVTVRDSDAATVGAITAAAGVPLTLLQQRGPSLEDVFLDLVYGRRSDSPRLDQVANPVAHAPQDEAASTPAAGLATAGAAAVVADGGLVAAAGVGYGTAPVDIVPGVTAEADEAAADGESETDAAASDTADTGAADASAEGPDAGAAVGVLPWSAPETAEPAAVTDSDADEDSTDQDVAGASTWGAEDTAVESADEPNDSDDAGSPAEGDAMDAAANGDEEDAGRETDADETHTDGGEVGADEASADEVNEAEDADHGTDADETGGDETDADEADAAGSEANADDANADDAGDAHADAAEDTADGDGDPSRDADDSADDTHFDADGSANAEDADNGRSGDEPDGEVETGDDSHNDSRAHDDSAAQDDFDAHGDDDTSEHAEHPASDGDGDASAPDDTATDEAPDEDDDAATSLRDAVAGLWAPRVADTADTSPADAEDEDETATREDAAPEQPAAPVDPADFFTDPDERPGVLPNATGAISISPLTDRTTFTELITGIPASASLGDAEAPAPATEAIPVFTPPLSHDEDDDEGVVDDIPEDDPRLAAMRSSLSSAASRFFDGPAPDYPYGDVPKPDAADEQESADAEQSDDHEGDENPEGDQHHG
ncbi:ATP-binding cassette domain-containing protein [Microbacterium arabinogalactanolyticum]|uniref:ATP-binding cassette domain-containing protein n=1 Tax=Microbacterium arabinogalactanolyticum TaxID=69365 RepID=UPI0040447B09